MNRYHQKPDNITPDIRSAYKRLGVSFIEPPSGLGCDIVVFRVGGGIVFVEVKEPGAEARMTDIERKLQRLCQVAGVPYVIVTNLENALHAAGITT